MGWVGLLVYKEQKSSVFIENQSYFLQKPVQDSYGGRGQTQALLAFESIILDYVATQSVRTC